MRYFGPVGVLLGGLATGACSARTPAPSAPLRPVSLTMDLTPALEKMAPSLRLNATNDADVLVPLHAAVEIKSAAGIHYLGTVKDGDELVIDLPTTSVETRALVILERRPANWRDLCSPNQVATGGSGTSQEGGGDGSGGGPLFAAAINASALISADTNDLPISFGDLQPVNWRRVAARIPDALLAPTTLNTSSATTAPASARRPTLVVYADALTKTPMKDPCTGTPFSDDALGGIVELGVPVAQLEALRGDGFRPFSPALPGATAGTFSWINVDDSVLSLPGMSDEDRKQDEPQQTTGATAGTNGDIFTAAQRPNLATLTQTLAGTERRFSLSLLVDSADADGDGVSNADELRRGTNPLLRPVTFSIDTQVPSEGGRLFGQLQRPQGLEDLYQRNMCIVSVDLSSLTSEQRSQLDQHRNQLWSSGQGQMSIIPPLTGPTTFPCSGSVSLAGVAGRVTLEFAVTDDWGFSAGGVVRFVDVPMPSVGGTTVSGPTIANIPPQTTNEDTPKTIGFQLQDPAGLATCGSLLALPSSNPDLLPSSQVVFSGTAPQCFATLTPLANRFGQVMVSIGMQGAATPLATISLDVTPVNYPPTDITLSNPTIVEGGPANSLVGLLGTADPDVGDTFSYSLVTVAAGGADSGSFSINGNELRLKASGDFETKSSYAVRIRSTDSGGLSVEKSFTVTVIDVNEAPSIANLSDQVLNEDASPISIPVTIGDPDGELDCATALTATSSNVALAGLVVEGSYPHCLLRVSPAANQNGTATITLTVSDGSLSSFGTFVLTVNPVNDEPTVVSVGDNSKILNQDVQTAIVLDRGSDPDTTTNDQTLSYWIATPPANGTLNSIPSNAAVGGSLNYQPATNYVGSDSFWYQICDSHAPPVCTTVRQVMLTVDSINTAPTNIMLSASAIDENAGANAVVGTLSTSDPDAGNTFSYSLVAGDGDADNGAFNINGDQLRLTASADFETKNSYAVRIRTTDAGGLFFDKGFTVTVTNVNEAPVMTIGGGPNLVTDEDMPLTGIPVSITDVDSTLSCSSITAFSGDLVLLPAVNIQFSGDAPDCEASFTPAPDRHGTVTIILGISDGSLSVSAPVTLVVNPVNDAPTDIALSSTFLMENKGPNAFVGSLTAVDPDGGDTFNFTVSGQGDFDVQGNHLKKLTNADFEDQPSYPITITVTDFDGLSFTKDFTISIENMPEASWQQEAYIKAGNGAAGDLFGYSVSVSGDTIAVGAIAEDKTSVILHGTENNMTSGPFDSGAVYLYRRSGPTWNPEAYIKASNAFEYDMFGKAINLSGDTLAVGVALDDRFGSTITHGTTAQTSAGAADSGAVYVYRRNGTQWAQEAYIKAANAASADFFGQSVSVHGDTIVAGAPGEDSNQSVISNGTTASSDDSAMNSGAVFVYRRTGTTWVQEAYIKAANVQMDDKFGSAVSLFGDTLVVGAPFESENSNVIVNGATAPNANGADASGAVYVYRRNGTNWDPEAYIKAFNAETVDRFGEAISLSGNHLAVGAPGEDGGSFTITNGTSGSTDNGSPDSGAVYVYRHTGSAWVPEAYIKTPNGRHFDWVGDNISLSGNTLAVGVPNQDSMGTMIINGGGTLPSPGANSDNRGAVYVFQRAQWGWFAESYIKASNAGSGDKFGGAVSLDGNLLAVGAAYEESSQTTIINGPAIPTDGAGPTDSGAVYVYRAMGRLFEPNIRVLSKTSNSITFAWSPESLGGGNHYVKVAPAVLGGAEPEEGCNVGGTVPLSPASSTYEYSGLSAGTAYAFRFCSSDGPGVTPGVVVRTSTP